MATDDDVERDNRAKDRALAKRDSYVARIKDIHATARLASDDASMAPQLRAASTRLDNLLAGFEVEDSAVTTLIVLSICCAIIRLTRSLK